MMEWGPSYSTLLVTSPKQSIVSLFISIREGYREQGTAHRGTFCPVFVRMMGYSETISSQKHRKAFSVNFIPQTSELTI